MWAINEVITALTNVLILCNLFQHTLYFHSSIRLSNYTSMGKSIPTLILTNTNSWFYLSATIAANNGKPVYKYKTWRVKGKVIPEILEEYKSVSNLYN